MHNQVQIEKHRLGFLILSDDDKGSLNANALRFHGKILSEFDEDNFLKESDDSNKKARKKLNEHKSSESHTKALLAKLPGNSDLQSHTNIESKSSHNEEKNKTIVDTRFREFAYVQNSALSPLYIYPKVSLPRDQYKELPENFLKFKEFVLAGCIRSFTGIDRDGIEHVLNDPSTVPTANIVAIKQIDENLAPYETMILSSFMHLAQMTKQLGTENCSVRYHLPKIDYMLYGVRLYLRGVFSQSALDAYVKQVAIRANIHKKILEKVAKYQDISLSIESPFSNLFDPNIKFSAETFINLFSDMASMREDISKIDPATVMYQNLINAIEKQFAHKIIRLLQGNAFDKRHQKTWNELFNYSPSNTEKKTIPIGSITNLRHLFQVANSLQIASATMQEGVESNEICVILPSDEMPIFNTYMRKIQGTTFKAVVALFWLQPILSYLNKKTLAQKEEDSLFRLNIGSFCTHAAESGRVTEDIVDFMLPNMQDKLFFFRAIKEACLHAQQSNNPSEDILSADSTIKNLNFLCTALLSSTNIVLRFLLPVLAVNHCFFSIPITSLLSLIITNMFFAYFVFPATFLETPAVEDKPFMEKYGLDCRNYFGAFFQNPSATNTSQAMSIQLAHTPAQTP